MVSNRVTFVKEKPDFDINNYMVGKKKERRIREALSYYYTDLAQYTTSSIVKELERVDVDFPEELPIVVSGGTSKSSRLY